MAMKLVLAALLGLARPTDAASPIQKVTDLLKEMHDQLELDEKSELNTYNKYACWCKSASDKKAAAIDEAQKQLRTLGQSILTLKGEIATHASEIAKLTKLLEDNAKMQEESTELRSKNNAEYMAFTAETKQAMVALEKAIAVLIKGATAQPEAASLLQSQGRDMVRKVVSSLGSRTILKDDQVSSLSLFLQGESKYTPQSMTVQGILKDMYTTFATDVEFATNTEAKQNRDFEALIASLIEEANEMKKDKAAHEESKAQKEVTLADESQLYDDTKEQMEADIAFFDAVNKACKSKHEEWTVRSDLRTEEIAGIAKAIELLSSDDARELLASAIRAGKEVFAQRPPSLLQVGRGASVQPALSAYKALKEKASSAKSLRLASLAASVAEAKAGHFEQVIKAIDGMVQTLKDEEAADIAKRDQCKEEITQSNATVLQLKWEIKCNQAKIDKLQRKIDEKNADIEQCNKDITQTETYIKDTTDVRTQDNSDFKEAKKTDEAAIALLQEVHDVLAKYYKKNKIDMGSIQGAVKGLALNQKKKQAPEFEISDFDAPDATFSKKDHRAGEAKGVLSILTMVIEDLHDEITNDMKSEEASQVDYEALMFAAKTFIAKNEAKIVFLEGVIADTEKEKADETKTKNTNSALLEDEEKYLASIVPDCYFVFRTFFERADKRAAEMEGLTTAKAYLVGGAALAQLPAPKMV